VGEPIVPEAVVESTQAQPVALEDAGSASEAFQCDRCGSSMIERGCKLICPNCGNRFDCSDLSVYMD
jgi:Zn finger protein HypA/HybF involved in hydrogenase expression